MTKWNAPCGRIFEQRDEASGHARVCALCIAEVFGGNRDGSPNPDDIDPLPEGAIETGRIVIRPYLNADGKNTYALTTRGDNPASTYLGLLVMAQRDILEWALEDNS